MRVFSVLGAQMSDEEVNVLLQAEQRPRETWLLDLTEECLAAHGSETKVYIKPQLHIIEGHASSVVPVLAKELSAELIVMGTIARSGIPGYLMVNTAETILNQIDSSVLGIKPAGFVSPIRPKAAQNYRFCLYKPCHLSPLYQSKMICIMVQSKVYATLMLSRRE